MDFSFSSEQTLLQDSVERFIQNDYGFDQRQKLTGSELGFSKEHWSHFAELGWLGLPFAEEDGGFGGCFCSTSGTRGWLRRINIELKRNTSSWKHSKCRGSTISS